MIIRTLQGVSSCRLFAPTHRFYSSHRFQSKRISDTLRRRCFPKCPDGRQQPQHTSSQTRATFLTSSLNRSTISVVNKIRSLVHPQSCASKTRNSEGSGTTRRNCSEVRNWSELRHHSELRHYSKLRNHTDLRNTLRSTQPPVAFAHRTHPKGSLPVHFAQRCNFDFYF